MWTTLIPTAIAAALLATVVNLASEINKIQGARHLPGASVASLLITTEALVAEKPKKTSTSAHPGAGVR